MSATSSRILSTKRCTQSKRNGIRAHWTDILRSGSEQKKVYFFQKAKKNIENTFKSHPLLDGFGSTRNRCSEPSSHEDATIRKIVRRIFGRFLNAWKCLIFFLKNHPPPFRFWRWKVWDYAKSFPDLLERWRGRRTKTHKRIFGESLAETTSHQNTWE